MLTPWPGSVEPGTMSSIMKRDVLGLHFVKSGEQVDPRLARVRDQLRAADALITIERDMDEPEPVQRLRRKAEALLQQRQYEDAEAQFLDCIDLGLQHDYFPWHAAVNLVNCHRLLARLDDAYATATQLVEMYEDQPDHPIRYLLATQLGAIAADRFEDHHEPADAAEALARARSAYEWLAQYRTTVDGLRAYNLVVALLRTGGVEEAREVYLRHRDDESFMTWCREGDQAAVIAALLG